MDLALSLNKKYFHQLPPPQVPPESVLLPISTHLVHFLNKRQPKLQARDAGIWWGTLGKLQLMLRKAARALYQNDKVGGVFNHQVIFLLRVP